MDLLSLRPVGAVGARQFVRNPFSLLPSAQVGLKPSLEPSSELFVVP